LDIPFLVEHFVKTIAQREGMLLKKLSSETLDALVHYPWPGNVRQLENAIEMAMIVSQDRTELILEDFSLPRDPHSEPVEMTDDHLVKLPEHGLDFQAVIARIEFDLLEQALSRTNGNKKIAADILRLKRTTLAAKLKSLEESFPELARISDHRA
jgi:DNA-binding NtrC family response regulator